MSHDLHEHLEGYSSDAALDITVDPHDAWRSGRRRRRTRRLAVSGAAAGLATAVVFIAVGAPGKVTTDPAANHPGVDQHPVRVADSWFTGELEADSGPMAGIVEGDGFERFAITDEGRALEIAPDEEVIDSFLPSLSSDGTKLGYLRGSTTYVLHDLARGTVVELDSLSDNQADSTRLYMAFPQHPAAWSPSGERLLITGSRADETSSSFKLVLGFDGTISDAEVPRMPSANRRAGQTAGWADDEHVGWVQEVGREGSRGIDYVVTDLDGAEVSRTPLDLPVPEDLFVSQWTGDLSPDGSRLAVTLDSDISAGELTYVVDTQTGQAVDAGARSDQTRCPPSWRGNELLMPAYLPNPEGGSELRTLEGERITVVDPAFGSSCIVLVSDALTGESAGGPVNALFGTSDSWLSWRYQEVAAGFLAFLVLVLAGFWFIRRRRSTSPRG